MSLAGVCPHLTSRTARLFLNLPNRPPEACFRLLRLIPLRAAPLFTQSDLRVCSTPGVRKQAATPHLVNGLLTIDLREVDDVQLLCRALIRYQDAVSCSPCTTRSSSRNGRRSSDRPGMFR